MLNVKDLIGEIQERARERKLSTLKKYEPFSSAEPNGEIKDDIRLGSAELKPSQTDNNEKDKSSISN